MSETPRTDFVENGPTSRRAMPYLARDLERELARLKAGIKVVLTQNAHLADGETCTLAGLKKLVPEWQSEFLSNDQAQSSAGLTHSTCLE